MLSSQRLGISCGFRDKTDLWEKARARGGDIRVVYSPLDALALAKQETKREVVFLGVGFETTTPAIAGTIKLAEQNGITNFTVFPAHKTMPPAMTALLKDQDVRVDGFICPGHVSVIIGYDAYLPLSREYHIPCVVAGFEPEDMVAAIERLVLQVAENKAEVENVYSRSVTQEGNTAAQELMTDVFHPVDAVWRGLGMIPGSGLDIKENYADFDSRKKFGLGRDLSAAEPVGCKCGDILRGTRLPPDCVLFGKACTPENPVGACMVSSEGTCAAYFKYGRK